MLCLVGALLFENLALASPAATTACASPYIETIIAYNGGDGPGGITCGANDEPRKSSKVIDECVIINFCDKMS